MINKLKNLIELEKEVYLELMVVARQEAYIYFDKNIRELPRKKEGSFDESTGEMSNNDADAFRQAVLEHCDMSLGNGLGRLAGKVFRIGHLGDLNDQMLARALNGIEMGLALAQVPHKSGGAQKALDHLSKTASSL